MIDHQPPSRRFDWRGGYADLVRIPPRAAASFQHKLVVTPMAAGGRIRGPDVRAEGRHGPMDQRPESVDPPRQEGSIFVVWGHNDSESLIGPEVLCEGQRHAGATPRV